ncbi:helix-turn-helix transcriptional regulator [Clostridium oryzae]|uniref:Right origin-binding protein n=1 Tax=Clostridium oryzae TaxID=1450648 RepID=A0A1V4IKD6_9CLOT|nr:AraC family transcriptional regulator [Clostridium oryzae]OPJ60396.1 right origin-binding protein [Clostridium oryzae]
MAANKDVISKIINYIEDHLTDELDLDKIAKIAGYSKYHLNRMFSNVIGCTIHQYIQNRRLTEAAKQLVFTDKSIIDIAFNTGYETHQSFTLAFKNLYRESPQTYRKKGNFIAIQPKCIVLSEIRMHKNKNISYINKFNTKCEVKAA